MPVFLRRYLLVTGVLAVISATMPVLIIIGFIAGVAPGVALALAPTAFLYGVLFTAGWLAGGRRLGRSAAPFFAAMFVAAFVLGVPAFLNREAASAIAELRREDRAASAPATVTGVLRIERRDGLVVSSRKGEPRFYVCEDLCAAALFTPGITSVVIAPAPAVSSDPSPAPKPRTDVADTVYRLTPRLAGGSACDQQIVPVEGGPQLMPWPALPALRVAWKIALAAGDCIRREPVGQAPPAPDWTLRLQRGKRESAPRPAGLEPRLLYERVTLEDRQGVVLRSTQVDAQTLSDVLFYELAGGKEDMHIGWARRRFMEGAFEPIGLIAATTTLGVTAASSVARGAEPSDVRAALRAALDDPALPSGAPAFSLVRSYLDGFSSHRGRPDVQPGDAALVARLVADPRVRDFSGIWQAVQALGGDDAATLRAPMVSRMLASRYPEDREPAKLVGHALSALPEGAFAEPSADEFHLLGDDPRRRWATGLVARQGDRGAAAAGDLARIMTEAYSRPIPKSSRDDPDRLDDASAARRALCVLGPLAAPALPELEALARSGLAPPRATQSDDFQLMLVRLGKPVESVVKPEWLSGTQDAFVERMRRRLDRFQPHDCH